MITGSSDTPMQVTQGLNIPRHDLKTTHEEADLIIIQQCYGLIFDSGCNSVTIISDDTDVFVLACHYFPIERSDVTVIMESTKSCLAIVDIGKTATKHYHPFLLLMHSPVVTVFAVTMALVRKLQLK